MTKRMNGYISKCKSEACRLMPVFGLLFIALAGFCLTGVFAESQKFEGDGTLSVVASFNRNALVNGSSFQSLSNGFSTLAPRSTHQSNSKSKVDFGAVGEDEFNLNGARNRFGNVNGNQSLFK